MVQNVSSGIDDKELMQKAKASVIASQQKQEAQIQAAQQQAMSMKAKKLQV